MADTEAPASSPPSKNKRPPGDKEKTCMPDNPFLPDSIFGSNDDKIKAHVGIFLALIVGLRLARMFANSECTKKM